MDTESKPVEQTAEEPEKFIVEVWDGLNTQLALQAVMKVVKMGRISETSKGRQHCFCTAIKTPEFPHMKVFVVKNDKSERFIVQLDR